MAIPISLVWGLNAAIATKINVVLGFSFRLLYANQNQHICLAYVDITAYRLLMIIAFRLQTFPKDGLTANPTLRLVHFIVWTQTELNWSIVSATIPSLRPFLQGFSTYTGALSEYSNDSARRYQSHHSGHVLSELDSINHGSKSSMQMNNPLVRQRATERDATSVGSNDSQGMIIRKDNQL